MPEAVSQVKVLAGKRVTLGVTGSVAAYKSVGLASTLHQAGAIVDVAMTPDAQRFVQPLSFQAVTHRPVFDDLWAPGMETDIAHVTLGRESAAIVVAPATANVLAKLAHGLADDPVSVTVLAARCPVLVAPAMDAGMFTHPATAANVATLRERGVIILPPEEGHLASGLTGLGRMASPETIFDLIRAALGKAGGDLVGRRVLVTAGGTQEPIDPVRYITNHSSGKMGYAIAEAARDRGADVVLVTTPTALRVPAGLSTVNVRSAQDMLDTINSHYEQLDALIMVAAVADFRVETPWDQKVKRGEHALDLRLIPNPDLLAATAAHGSAGHPVRVGFAAETQDLLEHAREKLARKSLDLIVANDVSDDVFGADSNQVTLVWSGGRRTDFPRLPKAAVADHVLNAVSEIFGFRGEAPRGNLTNV